MIEPGVIRTNFTDTAMSSADQYRDSVYAGVLDKADAIRSRMERFASGPQVIARAIRRAVERRRPAARYVAPFSTWFALLFKVMMPTRTWDWAMRTFSFLSRRQLDAAPAARRRRPAPAAGRGL